MSKIGYIRVSSDGQTSSRQREQLEKLDLDIIYKEIISGATMNRLELQKLLSELTAGNIIYVPEFTRIARST